MDISGRFFRAIALFAGIASCLFDAAWGAGFTIDFDHLPTLGPTNGNQSFADANGGSNTFQGVTFATNFRVAGDQYRIGGPSPNPPFGVPHSGHYFLNNGNTPNNDLIFSTVSVLTEAWFGRNEYYGYGGGASSVTVTAFGGAGDLASITLNLPDTFPYTGNLPPPDNNIGNGLPDPMVRMDTSSFLGLVGITGYRINRFDSNPYNGNWVADDFTFADSVAIAEPDTPLLLAAGLLALLSGVGRRMRGRLLHRRVR